MRMLAPWHWRFVFNRYAVSASLGFVEAEGLRWRTWVRLWCWPR